MEAKRTRWTVVELTYAFVGMFFFFFFQNDPSSLDAPRAYREVLAQDGITNTELMVRAGVTSGAISKFLKGRPLSPGMLKALCGALSVRSRRLLLIAHLRDEVRRAGQNPTDFTMLDHGRNGQVLQRVMDLVQADSERVHDLIELVARWEKSALAATLAPSTVTNVNLGASKSTKGRKRRG